MRGLAVAAIIGSWFAIVGAGFSPPGQATPAPIVWDVDNLSRIGGHAVQVIGSPRVVTTEFGKAVAFNGQSDGLLVEGNPLAGLTRFTIEVLFSADLDGGEEQRFLHIQETGSQNRAMVELRLAEGRWSLDTFLVHGKDQLTLLDRTRTHTAAQWHVATLTFDGQTMAHYVDGIPQGAGAVAFKPLADGRTAIGVRQNLVSWFKGRIKTIRVTPAVLSPAAFLAAHTGVIALWPEGVPGRHADGGAELLVDGRVTNVHNPSLTVRRPAPGTANGTAMILCAGGSYTRLAITNEVDGIAPYLTDRGVTVFVLKYRLADYGHPAPLRDVLRAVRMVRSRADEFGIRPDRIGVFGASAGGHLAASAATMFDDADGRTGAPLDAVSARPDFVALQYPVVTMRGASAHADSRRNLIGTSTGLAERLSIETRVTKATPPMFVVHTSDDRSVPIENSLMLVRALRAAGVSVESHFYERGAHGFGVSAGLGATSEWPLRLVEWMTAHGWLQSSAGGSSQHWARGIEGQRKADLGDGTFLNPIMAGDRPDPSVLKDGDDYYMTHSSFDAYPGLVIWHSKDLVNWQPVGPTLVTNVGSVWAPDLVKHNGRYYIYFPGVGPYRSNYVIWSDDIRGPWSEPIDLKIDRIDPGHSVSDDGRRFLFMSGGYRVPLAADGLSVTGPAEKVYDGWQYPAEWIVESFSQEGPKMLKRGGYYYMVLAEGGTAGPPTGHMVIAARSRSIDGPWEDSPHNPIVRTTSADERWWSKGHGTVVEGPAGQWYLVYHAYENGFYTLGRQTLLEPITWTDAGWFRTTGVDVARPITKPAGVAVPHGVTLSDDFTTNKVGTQWSFYKGTAVDRNRLRHEAGALVLSARGRGPADASPLGFVAGDQAYEIAVEIDADPGASAGLLLFYSSRLYAGLGFSASNLILHRYGTDRLLQKPKGLGQTLHLRLRNDRQIVTIHLSIDGVAWERFGTAMEVSGYHHNVAGEFLSLKPAIYAAGTGEVRFKNFRYSALP